MEYTPNPLLYGAHREFLSSFKLVVTLREAVNHGLLCRAVALAMKRYPYFCVTPCKKGDELRLVTNPAPVPVFCDERCAVLGSPESDGHLLAFGCGEKRIVLHASHYIADGMGICPLLMTVLYLYLSEVHGPDGLDAKGILLPDDPVDEAEYAYPFPEFPASREAEQVPVQPAGRAYALDPAAFDSQGLYAYHLHLPQGAMMRVASPSDGSPVSFLSVALFRALCALDPALAAPVVAHVQHQYRAAIRAPRNRHSLVSYIPARLSPRIKERSAQVQNTVLRGQIILASEPEQDLLAVKRLVSVFPKDTPASLAQKQQAMRQYVANSIDNKTFGISYVGKMDWCGMDRYVEDLHVYIGEAATPNMLLIEVMTVGEDFSLTFMQSGRGRRYVDAFMQELGRLGVPVRLVGQERYGLCETQIPQE